MNTAQVRIYRGSPLYLYFPAGKGSNVTPFLCRYKKTKERQLPAGILTGDLDMNKKLKVTVAIIQIVGGLVGIGIIGLAFLTDHVPLITAVIHTTFMLIFTYGIVAGLVLITFERLGMILSAIFQAIQIPVIIGPTFSYCMFSGASFKIFKHITGFGFDFGFGSYYNFYINSGQQQLLGINILALVLFILLIRGFRISAIYTQPAEPQPHTMNFVKSPEYREDTESYGIPLRLHHKET